MIGKLILPIILQLLGIGVIIAEFMVPSFGLLTVLSLSLFGYSLYFVFTQVSINAGYAFLTFDILISPILILIGTKMIASSPATLKSTLSRKDGAMSQPDEWELVIGKVGKAITDLRPAGTVLIDNVRYDVVSRGEYIEKGSVVKVIVVDSNRIVVKEQSLQNE